MEMIDEKKGDVSKDAMNWSNTFDLVSKIKNSQLDNGNMIYILKIWKCEWKWLRKWKKIKKNKDLQLNSL